MTCVLGMVVRREREIRSFVKTPFYRVIAGLSFNGRNFEGEWRAVKKAAAILTLRFSIRRTDSRKRRRTEAD